MKRVLILKGLPASGKTTYAKKLVDENPGMYKRVNKDDMRAMLDNGKWSKDNEKLVLQLRDHIILESLLQGKHVIVDDTNLAEKHETKIRELVKGKAQVEIIDFSDVPLQECIRRDALRENSVGEDVIRDMYNNFLKVEIELEWNSSFETCVICDIDGTLAHMDGRSPYDYTKVETDTVDRTISTLVNDLSGLGYKIILLSGRDGSCRDKTEAWLSENMIPYDHLYMRAAGDKRKDYVIKRELYNQHIFTKYNVLFVLDDRNQVVDMWRDNGLKCLQVAEGNF